MVSESVWCCVIISIPLYLIIFDAALVMHRCSKFIQGGLKHTLETPLKKTNYVNKLTLFFFWGQGVSRVQGIRWISSIRICWIKLFKMGLLKQGCYTSSHPCPPSQLSQKSTLSTCTMTARKLGGFATEGVEDETVDYYDGLLGINQRWGKAPMKGLETNLAPFICSIHFYKMSYKWGEISPVTSL